jgi:hypothetical protein
MDAPQITDDWYSARNTLTHRQLGPVSTATIQLNVGSMADGDRAGLGLLRDQSAYIGVWRNGTTYALNMVTNITMDSSTFATTSTGTVAASAPLRFAAHADRTVFLRVVSDSTPGSAAATFWYSTDGAAFHRLGPAFSGETDWHFFEGQR